LNQLDLDYHPRDLDAQNNSKSIFWAKSVALDKSGSVTPLWKKSFQEMAVSAHYRSLQIEASTGYFLKAKSYFEAFRFRELRYLLMMYDFVVQNGGFNSQHLSRYQDWLMANPNASEEERAFGLLEVRLTTVRPQFVADVRARKTTIIKGAGTVHQTPRDLPKEYCFDPRVSTESN